MSHARLAHFPITLFGSVMGLAGLTIAFARFESILKVPLALEPLLRWGTSGWFALLLAIYLLKAVVHRKEVLEEWTNPVRVNFFPAISISALLLAIAWLEGSPQISWSLWTAGAVAHLWMSLVILKRWVLHEQNLATFNPAWFIPVVGNMLVPVAGVAHAAPMVNWFFFSVGLILWGLLFSGVTYRLLFHSQVPEKLLPTLFIMLAPPAVSFIAWVKLTGGLDAFGRVMFSFALFSGLVLLSMGREFMRLPFFMSWWAFTFPAASLLIATLLMEHLEPSLWTRGLAWTLLPVVSSLVLLVAVRTGIAAMHRQVCVPET